MMAICLLIGTFLKTSTLSVLLCLEALVVVCVLILVQHSELMFRVCFICIGACESAVGLGCLVSLVRRQGDQYLSF